MFKQFDLLSEFSSITGYNVNMLKNVIILTNRKKFKSNTIYNS